MKSFRQLIAEAAEERAQELAEASDVTKGTLHLKMHEDGTSYVVKNNFHTLKKGERIHDTHLDDLHDAGIKTKIHEEAALDEAIDAEIELEEGKTWKDSDRNKNRSLRDLQSRKTAGKDKQKKRDDQELDEADVTRDPRGAHFLKVQNALTQIEGIKNHLNSEMKRNSGGHPVDWGHVSDAEHIHGSLRNLHHFIVGDD